MGCLAQQGDHAAMDDMQLHHSEVPAIRSFRICLDRPQRPATILGVIRRVAAEQAGSGQDRTKQVATARSSRRTSVFA
jgi:hypothetical protein